MMKIEMNEDKQSQGL